MDNLPQDCIAKILSLTTPRDVCRSSCVSKLFISAADSDDVWNQFLPAELPAGFASPEDLPTRKHLFFSLVNNPLLLHETQLSFSLERMSGKKCYMIGAKALSIVWGDDERYWQWISLPNNTTSKYSFTQVAELKMVWWLDISTKFDITLLSDETLYVAYLVFTWNSAPYGFRQPVEASLVFEDDVLQPSMVSLMQTRQEQESQFVDLRADGWYEVQLGQFFKRRGDIGLIEMSLKETHRPYEKKGLVVHGIEIRPLLIANTS